MECYICGKEVVSAAHSVQCDMCTMRKVLYLKNLERDSDMSIRNRIDYNTAAKYRESNPPPPHKHTFLAALKAAKGVSTQRQTLCKGLTLKPIKKVK